jgi:hypothetical protein
MFENEIHPLKASSAAALQTAAIARAALRYCGLRGWAALPEMPLPNGRRADLLALLPDGGFAIIEVKSGPRDFTSDLKWPEYRDFCDRLYFAVALDFPQPLLPADAGLLVAADRSAVLLREAPEHRLAGARRRALLHRFARLGALRAAALADPDSAAELRAAMRLE